MAHLHIKHMVCSRCIMVVRQALEGLGYTVLSVALGQAVLAHKLNKEDKASIEAELQRYGFALLDDKRSQTVEQVKTLIIARVKATDNLSTNLSDYLSRQLAQDYSALSKLFSESQGTTIEQYYILQRIERTKELLVYNELSLSQIAYTLHYSSVAHLSRQFKQVTGLTPTQFKQLGGGHRRPLEEL